MTALELLTDLRARGVKLWVDGADLRFSAPKGTLGFNATELLARHKAELVELLQAPAAHAPAPPRAESSRPAGATRQRPNETRGFSLDNQIIGLASLPDWHAEEQHPYIRYVAPYRGFLYQRLALDKIFVGGKGCYLFDTEGTPYADFIAQFGAVPFGHDPQPIWDALDEVRREGRPNLVIGSISAAAGALAERLIAVAPPGLAHVVFTNSGAEAVEAAIKLARCRTGRVGILSARNGFHGLTLAGMSATDKEFFQRGFGAPVAGFNYLPFGDLAALQSTLALRPDFFAAFMVEIIQGESGIHVAPPGYVAAARDLCHRFGTLLIVDEVQTGLGRTGRLFACEEERVTPDILTLAKALGGGLMPIGACLYTRSVFSEHFDLRHGSTFAGNALACRAALATIDELTRDDQRLVRHVADVGRRLQEQLRQLQREYPALIREIRGRGLMLGVELDFDHIAATQKGLVAVLQQQGLLLYMAASYLLNVEHIRIAPSFTQGSVLRIEPPLIADAALCDRLVAGLRRLLDILERGDAGALLGHFATEPLARLPAPAPQPAQAQPAQAQPAQARQSGQSVAVPGDRLDGAHTKFAFVVHLLEIADLRRFDTSLAPFGDRDLEGFKSRMAEFMRPFPYGEIAVRSVDGRLARGEMIMLPLLPAELLSLAGDEAVDLVQAAVDLAADRGAEVVGLGGFSSIIADGGLALRSPDGVSVTSGNSLTTWAAVRAIEQACGEHALALADSTVAVVGATGAIGHALAVLCAERAGDLILVGNPRSGDASMGRLREVAHDCRRHVARLAAAGHKFANGTWAARASALAPGETEADLMVTTDIAQYLPKSHVVLTATNAVLPFITAQHLRQGALVCDVSRPLNLAPDLAAQRADLRLMSGGLVRAPEASLLGRLEEQDRPNVLVACAAETIVLALSRYRARQLCGRLDVATIQELGELAESSGFSVAT
jgi:acetylornithine/succinyldiaminopimelate/putrescine aminotransferase/predicted amino acid dehydrogenase